MILDEPVYEEVNMILNSKSINFTIIFFLFGFLRLFLELSFKMIFAIFFIQMTYDVYISRIVKLIFTQVYRFDTKMFMKIAYLVNIRLF